MDIEDEKHVPFQFLLYVWGLPDQVDSRDNRQPLAGRHGTDGGADVARDADAASSSARDAFMRLLHSVRIAESDADLDRVLDTCPAAIGRMELNGILAKVEVRRK